MNLVPLCFKIQYSKVLLTLLISYLFLSSGSCSENPSSPNCDNKVCEERIIYHELNNGMHVQVYTPPDYDKNKTYPLLLINDGETAFANDAYNLALKLDQLIESGLIEPIIAVAIHSSGNRNNWYIPYEDPWITNNWGPYEPQAEKYAEEIFNHVIPSLKLEYKFDEDEIGILGTSLGGLISTWLGLTYPDKIKYSASLSGSFWIADYKIFEEVRDSYNNEQKFWFDIGTGEWNYYVPLFQELELAGVTPGKHSFYYEVPEGTHTIADWLKRIHYPLILFFGSDTYEPKSMEIILECIPSQSDPRRKFKRMNPLITLTNNVTYSLAQTASYTFQSGEIELGSEGSFQNNPDVESEVLVEFEIFSKVVTIPKEYCREEKWPR